MDDFEVFSAQIAADFDKMSDFDTRDVSSGGARYRVFYNLI